MSNLLDRASVVLTATAYNNGEALCVKPDDASGDFQFSRNSAATRVNAQGLVENVQILSSNLVQNGDFSEEGVQEVSNGSFSQEGSELIVNGDFSNGNTGWSNSNTNGFSVSNGKLNLLDVAYTKSAIQFNVTTVGKIYKVTYEVSDYVQGSFRLVLGGTTLPTIVANGVYTNYVTATNDTYVIIQAFSGTPTTLSIDNVSVREVGQNWELTQATIGDGEATIISPDGSYAAVYQDNVATIGKTYKCSIDVLSISGTMQLRLGSGTDVDITTIGTKTFYINAASTTIELKRKSGAGTLDVSITNISVKEVGQNWALVGDFKIGDNQSFITNASQYSQITQQSGSTFLTANRLYKLSADIPTISISNALAYRVTGGAVTPISTSQVVNGKFETEFIMPSNGYLWFQTTGSYAGLNATITNISVIEISSDTNLPRINYEGFSYQDALGSEEVVNGTFDSDTAWSKGAGWSIANGEATHTGGASYLSQSILNPNTQYKVKIKVSQASGSNFVQIYMGGSPASVLIQNVGEYEYIFTSQPSIGLGFALRGAGNITIDNVSVKEYLGQEVVPDSGCGSWLFESQSTNLIPNANQYSGNTVYYTVTPNQSSPDGENNATLFVEKTATANYFVNSDNAIITGGQDYAYSFFVKYAGLQNLPVNASDGISGFNANIDILNGTVNSGTAEIKDFGNGWYRVSMTRTVAATASNAKIQFNFGNQTGDGISGFYLFGYQIENLSYATSYIPTSGSTVTRNQDVCNNGGTGTGLINSTEGVLYAEIASLSNEVPSNYISLSDGTYSNRISILYSVGTNIIRAFLRVGGAVQADMTFTVSDIRDFHKVAFLYKENDFALWIDGVEVSTDTSGSTMPSGTLSKLSFSEINTAGGLFRGKTKALAVWKEALSDSELQSLTTI